MHAWRQASPTPPAGSGSTPRVPWRARWRGLTPLARDIIVVLLVKAVVLGCLWYAFFRAPVAQQMAMEPRQVERQIVAPRPRPEAPHAVR
jgi:hypothetical protein